MKEEVSRFAPVRVSNLVRCSRLERHFRRSTEAPRVLQKRGPTHKRCSLNQ